MESKYKISLAPLTIDQALSGVLKVKTTKKKDKIKKKVAKLH